MPSNLERVRKAMDAINLSKQVDQVNVFKTLSIILTLGNLEFIKGFRIGDSEDNVTIISRSSQICSTSETNAPVRRNPDSLDVLHQLLSTIAFI
jgi:myosin heavy subunit